MLIVFAIVANNPLLVTAIANLSNRTTVDLIISSGLLVLTVAIDISSKLWAIQTLKGSKAIVITPFLQLVYVENRGIAFGLFADFGLLVRPLIISIILLIVLGLVIYLWRCNNRYEHYALMLLLAGAVSNLNDRLRWGFVVDFIDLHWQNLHWPAFNVADIAISLSFILLLGHFYFPIFQFYKHR